MNRKRNTAEAWPENGTGSSVAVITPTPNVFVYDGCTSPKRTPEVSIFENVESNRQNVSSGEAVLDLHNYFLEIVDGSNLDRHWKTPHDEALQLELPAASSENGAIQLQCPNCNALQDNERAVESQLAAIKAIEKSRDMEIATLRKELDEREALIDLLIANNEKLHLMVLKETGNSDYLKSALTQEMAVTSSLRQNLRSAEDVATDLRQEFDTLRQLNFDLCWEFKARRNKSNELQRRLASYEHMNTSLQTAVKQLRATAKELREQLREFHPNVNKSFSQLSWKRAPQRFNIIRDCLNRMLGAISGTKSVKDYTAFFRLFRQRHPELFYEFAPRCLSPEDDLEFCEMAKISGTLRKKLKKFLTAKKLDIFNVTKKYEALHKARMTSGSGGPLSRTDDIADGEAPTDGELSQADDEDLEEKAVVHFD